MRNKKDNEKLLQSFYAEKKHWKKKAQDLSVEKALLIAEREIEYYLSSLMTAFSKKTSSYDYDHEEAIGEIYEKTEKILKQADKEEKEALDNRDIKKEIEIINITNRCKEKLRKIFEDMEKRIYEEGFWFRKTKRINKEFKPFKTKEELWQVVLSQIQFHISPVNFATWFKDTEIISKKGGMVWISVPNSFAKEWIKNKYHTLILITLHGLDEKIKKVKYIVEKSALSKRA